MYVPFLILLLAANNSRIFVLYHDAGHRSLFSSTNVNKFVEFLFPIFVITPHRTWTHEHFFHHQYFGLLGSEYSNISDSPLCTEEQYNEKSYFEKKIYGLLRSPFAGFIIGPIYWLFYIRYPFRHSKGQILDSSMIVSMCIDTFLHVLYVGGAFYLNEIFGFIVFAGIILMSVYGYNLFQAQHSHEKAFHAEEEEYDWFKASLLGSSNFRYKNPLLKYFSANIGYHSVHHIDSSIPNYLLEKVDTRLNLSNLEELKNYEKISDSYNDILSTFTWDMESKSWNGRKKRKIS